MYGNGTEHDQTLHFLHSVSWITNGLPGDGNLLVFENGVGQPEGEYSTVHELRLPYMEEIYGNSIWFAQDIDGAFKDPEFIWSFSSPGEFYSNFLSGQQRLRNGNTLIAEGMTGRIFELASGSDQLVWEYVNPVITTGPLSQGDPIPLFGPTGSVRLQNGIFRALRYGTYFSGFSGKDLAPTGPIELAVETGIPDEQFMIYPVYPNPFHAQTTISFQVKKSMEIELAVLNLLGQEVSTLANGFHVPGTYEYIFDASDLPSGLYLFRLMSGKSSVTLPMIHQ